VEAPKEKLESAEQLLKWKAETSKLLRGKREFKVLDRHWLRQGREMSGEPEVGRALRGQREGRQTQVGKGKNACVSSAFVRREWGPVAENRKIRTKGCNTVWWEGRETQWGEKVIDDR